MPPYRRTLALLVLAALPSQAFAQRFTRAEVVAAALRVNPAVQRGRANLSLLDGQITVAKADALPDLRVRTSAARYRDPALLNSSSFDSFPEELRGQLRPVGANLFETMASVTQTIFSFKLGHAIKGARVARSFGQEDLKAVEQAVALEAIRAYNALLYARDQVRLADNVVRQREQQLAIVRSRRAAGVSTDLEVLRTDVALANARAALTRTRGAAELSRANLNAVMLRAVDEPIETADTLAREPFPYTLDAVVAQAIVDRPELKGALLAEQLNDELVFIARAEKKPTFDFSADYGYSVREPSNYVNQDFSKWNFGAYVSIPVFDGFRAAGRVTQAEAQRSKATQDRIELENQIRLEARDAWERLTVAAELIDAADLNVKQAQMALDMTQANYRLGAATFVDVVDAQAAMVVAEATRNEALVEHANARATLLFVMGRDPLGTTP